MILSLNGFYVPTLENVFLRYFFILLRHRRGRCLDVVKSTAHVTIGIRWVVVYCITLKPKGRFRFSVNHLRFNSCMVLSLTILPIILKWFCQFMTVDFDTSVVVNELPEEPSTQSWNSFVLSFYDYILFCSRFSDTQSSPCTVLSILNDPCSRCQNPPPGSFIYLSRIPETLVTGSTGDLISFCLFDRTLERILSTKSSTRGTSINLRRRRSFDRRLRTTGTPWLLWGLRNQRMWDSKTQSHLKLSFQWIPWISRYPTCDGKGLLFII